MTESAPAMQSARVPGRALLAVQGERVQGQAGFFSEWADGVNIDRLPLEARAAWVQQLPAEWVRAAPRCSALRKCGSWAPRWGLPATVSSLAHGRLLQPQPSLDDSVYTLQAARHIVPAPPGTAPRAERAWSNA